MARRDRPVTEHTFVEDEPLGDVRGALAVLDRLSGDDDASPAAVTDAGTVADPVALLEGMATLLVGLVPLLGEDHWVYVPAVIRRLATFDEVDAMTLPTMAGALLAAADGISPLTWRRSLQQPGDGADSGGGAEVLRLPGDEAVALTCLTWLVVDLLDSINGPGSAARLVDEVLSET